MSGENVVALPGYSVPTPCGQPVASVVEIMREYLAKAESGELRAVALAVVCGNNDNDLVISNDFSAAAGGSWALNASIGRMVRRFNEWLDE